VKVGELAGALLVAGDPRQLGDGEGSSDLD